MILLEKGNHNSKCTGKKAAVRGGKGFGGAPTTGTSHANRRGPDAWATSARTDVVSQDDRKPNSWACDPKPRVTKLNSKKNLHLRKQSYYSRQNNIFRIYIISILR